MHKAHRVLLMCPLVVQFLYFYFFEEALKSFSWNQGAEKYKTMA
jgi:hypothetical protein